jgi:hypothetical protein
MLSAGSMESGGEHRRHEIHVVDQDVPGFVHAICILVELNSRSDNPVRTTSCSIEPGSSGGAHMGVKAKVGIVERNRGSSPRRSELIGNRSEAKLDAIPLELGLANVLKQNAVRRGRMQHEGHEFT